MNKKVVMIMSESKTKNSKARIEANNRYNAKAYEEIKLRVKKGEKDLIKSYAESNGKSLNGYIIDLIRADMQISAVEEETDV